MAQGWGGGIIAHIVQPGERERKEDLGIEIHSASSTLNTMQLLPGPMSNTKTGVRPTIQSPSISTAFECIKLWGDIQI